MSKEIGPRERALREQREARFERNQALQKAEAKKPSTSELREVVAAIKPKPKKAKKKKPMKR